eukprot:GILJ01021876.1.p1 GENE.GILJ01021876.1~~GILJ01021876.1.p1  ORF type:complete len:484 (-),score=43.20 GILJ01021876.1:1283-2734(-)
MKLHIINLKMEDEIWSRCLIRHHILSFESDVSKDRVYSYLKQGKLHLAIQYVIDHKSVFWLMGLTQISTMDLSKCSLDVRPLLMDDFCPRWQWWISTLRMHGWQYSKVGKTESTASLKTHISMDEIITHCPLSMTDDCVHDVRPIHCVGFYHRYNKPTDPEILSILAEQDLERFWALEFSAETIRQHVYHQVLIEMQQRPSQSPSFKHQRIKWLMDLLNPLEHLRFNENLRQASELAVLDGDPSLVELFSLPPNDNVVSSEAYILSMFTTLLKTPHLHLLKWVLKEYQGSVVPLLSRALVYGRFDVFRSLYDQQIDSVDLADDYCCPVEIWLDHLRYVTPVQDNVVSWCKRQISKCAIDMRYHYIGSYSNNHKKLSEAMMVNSFDMIMFAETMVEYNVVSLYGNLKWVAFDIGNLEVIKIISRITHQFTIKDLNKSLINGHLDIAHWIYDLLNVRPDDLYKNVNIRLLRQSAQQWCKDRYISR